MVKKSGGRNQYIQRMACKNIFVSAGFHYWYLLLIYLLTAVILNQITIKGNDYLADATDSMLGGQSVEIGPLLFPLLLMIAAGTIVSFMKNICGTNYSALVQKRVRSVLGRHLLRLPYCYFDEKGTGSIMTKLISDVGEAGRFFSEIFPDLLMNIITVVTVTIYLIQMDVMLIVVLFASYPIMLRIADWLSKRLTAVVKKRRSSMDQRTEVAYDAVQGIVVGRSYNLYEIMKKRIYYYIDDIAEQGCKSTKITSAGYVLKNTVTTIPVIICYLFALWETIRGNITTGEMLAFTILLSRILYPIGDIVFCINDIREVGVALHRIQDIFAEQSEESGTYIPDQTQRVQFTTAGNENAGDECADVSVRATAVDSVPAIAWKHVTFSYDGVHPVLNGVSFEIQKGENVAFAGGSGEGKSTIFRILCGFYHKDGGLFELFGHEYEDWNLEAARDCISMVSQNVYLFPESIWQNVAYGKQGATREEVIEACKNANIHEFIMKLPEAYDTQVGERGVLLSGGERQRISIARAFLKDAPILLLDEPTASVDVGTEEVIQEAIQRISQGRTVIIIAHRLSTIQNSDRIFVVNHGRIVETGSHAQLLQERGIYAGMYGKEVAADEEAV